MAAIHSFNSNSDPQLAQMRLPPHSLEAEPAVLGTGSLQSLGQRESGGGLAYIVALASNTPSAANIRRYAEIVRERSVMRRLAEVATGIADTPYSPAGRSASQLLDEAEAKVFEVAEAGS